MTPTILTARVHLFRAFVRADGLWGMRVNVQRAGFQEVCHRAFGYRPGQPDCGDPTRIAARKSEEAAKTAGMSPRLNQRSVLASNGLPVRRQIGAGDHGGRVSPAHLSAHVRYRSFGYDTATLR